MKRNRRTQGRIDRPLFESLESRRLLTTYAVDLGWVDVSGPLDINASGQVAGTTFGANGRERAFLWQNGAMTDLGTLGGPANYSLAYAINDAGQVVGMSQNSVFAVAAFLVTPEDTDGNGAPDRWFRDSNSDGKNDLMRDLGTIGGNYESAVARDVNNLGQVVGTVSTNWPTPYSAHGFRWQNGVMTDLGTTLPNAINDAGQVTTGSDINNAGQWLENLGGVARVWTPTVPNGSTGTFMTLGQLPSVWPDYYGSWSSSGAASINSVGHVVGTQGDEYSGEYWNGYTGRGIRWINGVPEELPLDTAWAINDAGQIVGMRGGRGVLLTDENFALPLVTIGGATVTEGHAGSTRAVFTVSLSRASAQTVTVQYATADGSATAGDDYLAAAGTITFAPGQTSRTVSVTVLGDRIPDYQQDFSEVFTVALTSPTNGVLAGTAATGTIVDDEARVFIEPAVAVVEGNSGSTPALITVQLSSAYDLPITLSYVTSDDTATAGSDYIATSGTLTFAPGETIKQIAVSILGDHVAEAYANPWDGSTLIDTEYVSLSIPDISTHAQVISRGGVAIRDDEARVSISPTYPTFLTVTEPATGRIDALFTISLSETYDQDVIVEYQSYDISPESGIPAVAGSDYVPTVGSVRIPAGEMSRTIAVPIIGDGVAEDTEYFYVVLDATSGNATIDGRSAWSMAEIRDHPVPLLTISGGTLTEGDTGTGNATFNVNLSAASAETVTVRYATADGAATGGSDYQAISGMLTFAPGETHKTISVAVNGDLLDESDESFFVVLSMATHARVVDGQGAGTIVDNDPPPSMGVGDFSRMEGRGGKSLLYFVVSLSAPSGKEVSVNFSTANGTARASGMDYQSRSGTLVFAPGQTQQTITVVVFGDRKREADETLFLNLSGPTNATLRDAQGVGTILNDDR